MWDDGFDRQGPDATYDMEGTLTTNPGLRVSGRNEMSQCRIGHEV